VTVYLFPDNTVLCNFASVDALPLLEKVLEGRGRWVEAIAFEAHRSARVLPALARIPLEGWLGDPIEVSEPHDVEQIERVRRAVFGGRADEPLRHLGEAQTCHVIQHWPEFEGSFWLSDDREALRFARLAGIPTRDTADLVGGAVHGGYVQRRDGYLLLQLMRVAGRHVRLPSHQARL
jgi:hypothetical protein